MWAVSLCIAALTLAACGGSSDDNAEPTDVDLAVSLVYPGASTGQATWVSSLPAGIDCGLRCINRYALDSPIHHDAMREVTDAYAESGAAYTIAAREEDTDDRTTV